MLAAQQSTFAGRFAVRAAARQTGRRTAVVVRAEETKVTKARARSCHARPARGWGCTGAVQRGGPISIGLYSGLVAACTAGPWPRHAPAACSQRLDGSPRSAAGPGVLLQADSSNLFARARLRLARPPRAGICRFKRGGRRRDSAVAASAHRRITTPPAAQSDRKTEGLGIAGFGGIGSSQQALTYLDGTLPGECAPISLPSQAPTAAPMPGVRRPAR